MVKIIDGRSRVVRFVVYVTMTAPRSPISFDLEKSYGSG